MILTEEIQILQKYAKQCLSCDRNNDYYHINMNGHVIFVIIIL